MTAEKQRDKTGRFVKGHSFGKRFIKNHNPWNKNNPGYKLNHYHLTEEGKKQKIKNKLGCKFIRIPTFEVN